MLVSKQVDWNAVMGFQPVVRKGPLVAVSGVGGRVDVDGQEVDGDAYDQTVAALAKIGRALLSVGAHPENVVHTRLYVHNAADWPLAGRAHGEFFASVGVALTMVEAKLVDPEMLVEIDVLAWVPEA